MGWGGGGRESKFKKKHVLGFNSPLLKLIKSINRKIKQANFKDWQTLIKQKFKS